MRWDGRMPDPIDADVSAGSLLTVVLASFGLVALAVFVIYVMAGGS